MAKKSVRRPQNSKRNRAQQRVETVLGGVPVMSLVTAAVTVTGTVKGDRIYRTFDAKFDDERVEYGFIPARKDCPAQHRIFTQRITRWQGEILVEYIPTLVTNWTVL